MGEVVKTGLLAGRPLWELPEEEMIRACAAFKAAVCLADPYEQKGRREILNLGHTFGHALEAASDYQLPHGEAVALGLTAALRLSGLDVPDVLDPQPVRVDRERAWAALQRDKKARGGRIRLVLLEEPGKPVVREADPAEVRGALDELIAG
jgi:3-dehydroquinate synthetase